MLLYTCKCNGIAKIHNHTLLEVHHTYSKSHANRGRWSVDFLFYYADRILSLTLDTGLGANHRSCRQNNARLPALGNYFPAVDNYVNGLRLHSYSLDFCYLLLFSSFHSRDLQTDQVGHSLSLS